MEQAASEPRGWLPGRGETGSICPPSAQAWRTLLPSWGPLPVPAAGTMTPLGWGVPSTPAQVGGHSSAGCSCLPEVVTSLTVLVRGWPAQPCAQAFGVKPEPPAAGEKVAPATPGLCGSGGPPHTWLAQARLPQVWLSQFSLFPNQDKLLAAACTFQIMSLTPKCDSPQNPLSYPWSGTHKRQLYRSHSGSQVLVLG